MQLSDERIIHRALIAATALDMNGVAKLNAAIRSVRWAMINTKKPIAGTYQDIGFREIVTKYYDAEMKMHPVAGK